MPDAGKKIAERQANAAIKANDIINEKSTAAATDAENCGLKRCLIFLNFNTTRLTNILPTGQFQL